MRCLQHKEEAYWFYRYLSLIYDRYVNPWFWTPAMRDQALSIAGLDNFQLQVAEVGAGTGFTTEAIVRRVDPGNIYALDQSEHQQVKAKRKPSLTGVTFVLGDAEQLPWETDRFDRYISAGSIEYWPDPQRAIAEAYRILKPGGLATLIGPLQPRHQIARFIANIFMLFPTEEEYRAWYQQAGFVDCHFVHLRPSWVQNEKYAIAIVGKKPVPGPSPWHPATPQPAESLREKSSSRQSRLLFLSRFLLGSLAGGLFLPIAIFKTALARLRGQQVGTKPSPIS